MTPSVTRSTPGAWRWGGSWDPGTGAWRYPGACPGRRPPARWWCRRRRSLALLGEEKGKHFVGILPFFGGAEEQVYHLPPPQADDAGGGIVPGLAAIEAFALLHQHGRPGFGGKAIVVHGFQEVDDGRPVPAHVQGIALAGVQGPVAHGHQHVPFPKAHTGLVDVFSIDVFADLRVIHMFAPPQQDGVGVIVLDQLASAQSTIRRMGRWNKPPCAPRIPAAWRRWC